MSYRLSHQVIYYPLTKISFVEFFLSYMQSPLGKKKSLKSLPEAAEGEMYVSAYTLRVGVLDVREHIQRKKIQRIFFFI